MNLNGRTALITGGASGIGAALGRALTERGARVGLVDVDADRLAGVAEGIPGAVSAVADVRDADAVNAAVEEIAGRLGGLDIAVANAGIATGGPLRLVATESVEDTIDINLLGVWRTARAALPFVLDRPDGYLLLVASAAALVTSPGLGAYSASKAGVDALGKALRAELAPHGVRVGVAYYLFLDTPMVRGGDEIAAFRETRSKLPGPIGKTHPLEPAIEATVAGIERRARTVCYPRYVKAMFRLRGLMDNALTDLATRRAIGPMEEAFAAEAEQIGPDAAARLPHQRPVRAE
jgi:NAD(P)-dependent dehydrogenase (short-subunit alcohol dehydrogenase family)